MAEESSQIPPRPQTIKIGDGKISTDHGTYGGADPIRPAQANVPAENMVVTDKRGRVLLVSRINALQFYRLTKVMKEGAGITESMNFAILASSVREIDGDPVLFPQSERQLESIIQKLDFDGITAVSEALRLLTPSEDEATEASKNFPGDPSSNFGSQRAAE